MTDELHNALTEIQGVGDATADKILDTLADHDTPNNPLLEKAVQAARDRADRDAAMWLRRWDGDR